MGNASTNITWKQTDENTWNGGSSSVLDKVDSLSREELLKIGKGKLTDETLSYIAMMEHHARDRKNLSKQSLTWTVVQTTNHLM
eukprot:13990898-Ditylum_brightwellii.AAC.1